MHTKIHDDRFRHSSNIKVIASEVSQAAVLVLPMGRIKYVTEMASDSMVYMALYEDWFRHSNNTKFTALIICESAMLILLMGV
jgi:hypothetical protein